MKKKRRSYTIEEKNKILNEIGSMSISKYSKIRGINKSIISRWLKNRGNFAGIRKTRKKIGPVGKKTFLSFNEENELFLSIKNLRELGKFFI